MEILKKIVIAGLRKGSSPETAWESRAASYYLPMRNKLAPALVLMLAACAAPTPESMPEPAPEASAGASPAPTSRSRVPRQAQRPPPIPVRPLNVKAECRFRDETGYAGSLRLSVEEARVRAFAASVTIPRRGTCRFDLAGFRQTREMPAIELRHLGGECVVRVWEQGERVTVAFHQCRPMCTGDAWDYLWPILADRRDGSCA